VNDDESDEMRALRMLAKHGICVASYATTEPGEGWKVNRPYPTVAIAALTDSYVLVEKVGSRPWATLTDEGRRYCESQGIEVNP
jgi:hypothetical protein